MTGFFSFTKAVTVFFSFRFFISLFSRLPTVKAPLIGPLFGPLLGLMRLFTHLGGCTRADSFNFVRGATPCLGCAGRRNCNDDFCYNFGANFCYDFGANFCYDFFNYEIRTISYLKNRSRNSPRNCSRNRCYNCAILHIPNMEWRP